MEFWDSVGWESYFVFPSNLRRLCLVGCFLTEEMVSNIARLRKLESLRLEGGFPLGESGHCWDVTNVEFPALKYLSLDVVPMEKWNASEASFLLLEKLVLKYCHYFKEIPPSFVDIPTLQLIELVNCRDSLVVSAMNIKKEIEENTGCDSLQVLISHESKFIESIIKQVLQEVNQSPLDVAWHPVGVDSHVEDIELLLQSGSGSLIIITTRDRNLQCGLRENEIYEAELLNDNEAMQLFSCRAFNSLFPPHEYVELAQDIIKYSGALPLALVTLGSHLHGRSLEEWKYEFKKLRGIPHSDIQKILKLSFDGLDGDTQSACFLDIACAFDGFFVDEVTKTLNACGFYSESAIATLVERHLLQRDGRRLVMHDLVRNMGREIVRMESPRDPGKWSRLFNPQEVRDVLQEKKSQ